MFHVDAAHVCIDTKCFHLFMTVSTHSYMVFSLITNPYFSPNFLILTKLLFCPIRWLRSNKGHFDLTDTIEKKQRMTDVKIPFFGVDRAIKFCTAAPNICVPILLAPKILRLLPEFFDGSVGIAIALSAGRSGGRIPVGAKFSAPLQTGPTTHPASCTMDTGSCPRIQRPRRGVNHRLPSSSEVKGRVKLCLYYPSGSARPLTGQTL